MKRVVTTLTAIQLAWLITAFACFWWFMTGTTVLVASGEVRAQIDAAERFVAVDAELIRCEVLRQGNNLNRVAVRFRYTIEGQTYESDKWSFDSSWTSLDTETGLAQKLTPGDQIHAFVDPQNPGVAIIKTGIRPSQWVFVGLFSTFAAFGVTLVALAVGTWAAAFQSSGVHRWHEQDRIVQPASRIIVPIVLSSGLSGVLLFGAMFATALSDSIAYAYPTFAATAVLLGALTLILLMAWAVSGSADTVIDRKRRTLTFARRLMQPFRRDSWAFDEIGSVASKPCWSFGDSNSSGWNIVVTRGNGTHPRVFTWEATKSDADAIALALARVFDRPAILEPSPISD